MKKLINTLLLLLIVVGSVQTASAKNWFGNNNRFGSGGWGYDNDCNDWPEWTPMYWMEEMAGNNDDCFDGRYRYPRSQAYPPRYPAQVYPPRYPGQAYPQPYQQAYPYAGAGAYGVRPYAARSYPAPLARGIYPPRLTPLRNGIYPPSNLLSGYGLGSIPRLPASSFGYGSLFSSPGGFASPQSSLGGFAYPGMSPMSSFSPASPFSPMGGLGSPLSPISPWSMGSPMSSGMGFPGMSPLSGGGFGAPWSSFGGSPFGGSGFSPFR
jgi:hypothetical protein